MDEIIKTDDVQNLVVKLRGQDVLLDRDVATLYGVKTKEVNQAVRNNPNKFPFGYIFEVDRFEREELVKNLAYSSNCRLNFGSRCSIAQIAG